MADYYKMYHILFNEITKAIEGMQKAQCETEELYMTEPEVALTIVQNHDNPKHET